MKTGMAVGSHYPINADQTANITLCGLSAIRIRLVRNYSMVQNHVEKNLLPISQYKICTYVDSFDPYDFRSPFKVKSRSSVPAECLSVIILLQNFYINFSYFSGPSGLTDSTIRLNRVTVEPPLSSRCSICNCTILIFIHSSIRQNYAKVVYSVLNFRKHIFGK